MGLVWAILAALAVLASLSVWPLESLARVAQVATAIVATFLGMRAWRGEDARLQAVGVDVHLRHREGGSDVALVSLTVFNPSSRGNVAKFVEVHRRRRDDGERNRMRPPKTEKRLVPDLAEDGTLLPSTYIATVALVGGCEVILPLEPPASTFPIGLAPFETKVLTVLVALPTVDAAAGEMLVLDLFDARRRRTRARTFGHAVRQTWWTRVVPQRWLQAYANREGRPD